MDDPSTGSVDRKESGDRSSVRAILVSLCRADLRCLDAHTHLDNLKSDRRSEKAIRHYEAGVRIGELSFSSSFERPLPWGRIDNRPFLRCLHGLGLCLWRRRKFRPAADVFQRMLRLNPTGNQGARFMVDKARARVKWTPSGTGDSIRSICRDGISLACYHLRAGSTVAGPQIALFQPCQDRDKKFEKRPERGANSFSPSQIAAFLLT